MIHEIERKYGVLTGLNEKYREMTSEELKEIQAKAAAEKAYLQTMDMVETPKLKIHKKVQERLIPTVKATRKSTGPIDYGWRV